MFRRLINTALFLFAVSLCSFSQNSQVLYYMNIPQNHLMNPALRPSNSFYIGFPGITSINLSVNNNFINFSDIILPGKGDSLITFLHPDYNIDDFLAGIHDRNFISSSLTLQLFGLGFNAGKDLYIFVDVTDRFAGNFAIPGDLIRLALKGNDEFIGKTIDLSDLDADFQYFREYGIGFSKNIGKNLRIGVKPKLLSGIMSASMENNSLGLTVNEDFTHTLDADLSVHLSKQFNVYYDEENRPDSITFDESFFSSPRFLWYTSNIGFGIDLGATFDIGNRFQVSAAVTDLGFISWSDSVTNMSAKSHFEFSGLNITDVINGDKTLETLGEEMLDSLKNSFVFSNDDTPYQTYLPVGISIGGRFNLTKSLSIGLLSKSTVIQKQIHEALTLSANLNLSNIFTTSLSYTAANSRYDNMGAGIALRLGFFQLYLIADRIPLYWNRIESTSENGSSQMMNPVNGTKTTSTPVPANWNMVNMRFGLNLSFGNKVNIKHDKPMLIEQN